MIIELLESKGFVQALDYTYKSGILTALSRTRDVKQIVHHEEVPAILGAEGDVIEPAVPAYDETVIIQETYIVQLPSLDELKREVVVSRDPALLVSEYLKDKQTSDNDSLNLGLFLNGGPGWRFESVPVPTIDELFDLIPSVESSVAQKQIEEQARAFLASTDWMVVRAMEKGETLSAEFLAQRQAARNSIV